MPNFIQFGGTGAFLQYGEMYTSCTFFIHIWHRFLDSLYRKNN